MRVSFQVPEDLTPRLAQLKATGERGAITAFFIEAARRMLQNELPDPRSENILVDLATVLCGLDAAERVERRIGDRRQRAILTDALFRFADTGHLHLVAEDPAPYGEDEFDRIHRQQPGIREQTEAPNKKQTRESS